MRMVNQDNKKSSKHGQIYKWSGQSWHLKIQCPKIHSSSGDLIWAMGYRLYCSHDAVDGICLVSTTLSHIVLVHHLKYPWLALTNT